MRITAGARATEILCRLGKSPRVAELGVFRGALSSRLLVRRDLNLVMIDAWGDYRPEYRDSTDFHAGLTSNEQEESYAVAKAITEFAAERREIIRCDSAKAAERFEDASFDCVFIDADHTYSGAKADIEAWLPKVKPGGLICGHDYDHPDFPGVREAVAEHFADIEVGEDYTWFYRVPGPAAEPSTEYDRIIVCCVKWGTKYGAEYVNILHDMVRRNISAPCEFWCFTDDPVGVSDEIHSVPLPPGLSGWWNKVSLFAPDAFPKGSRVLFLDLDVCVTGDLLDLVEHGGIIADWHAYTYNSSVMCWTHGEYADVWEKFGAHATELAGDQDWIASISKWPVFPAQWCVSYRSHAKDAVPNGSRVVCFHGEPKPHQVQDGWVPEVWKVGGIGVMRFISMTNIPEAEMLANIKANIGRAPMISVRRDVVAIVGGGPSLADTLDELREFKTIWALNGTHDYLIERGIVPTCMVMLDGRVENVRFVQKPDRRVTYLIAAQCHPAVFDALEGYNVRMWIGWTPGVVEMLKHGVVVGGGNTVGLKSICLSYMSGYRNVALFGFDSCYREDDGHAYPQDMNKGELMTDFVFAGGRRFKAARWMAKQAHDFQKQCKLMPDMAIEVYGDGLIQHIVRHSRQEKAA